MATRVIRQKIQEALGKHANSTIASQQKKYMKGVVEHYGLKSKTLSDAVFKPLYDTFIKKSTSSGLTLDEQINLANDLLTSRYFEEKQCGILLLNKNVKAIAKAGEGVRVVQQLEPYIDEHVYDWATCDTLSSRVICELIKLKPKQVAPIVEQWKDAPALWRQRSACVSFVKIARHGDHDDRIISICETCVTNQERFVQLGCGWVLRELSLADEERVVAFIKKNYNSFIREGLRYAIEKMDPDLKNELLNHNKDSSKKRKRARTDEKDSDNDDDDVDLDEEEQETEHEEELESGDDSKPITYNARRRRRRITTQQQS